MEAILDQGDQFSLASLRSSSSSSEREDLQYLGTSCDTFAGCQRHLRCYPEMTGVTDSQRLAEVMEKIGQSSAPRTDRSGRCRCSLRYIALG